jgi:ABC-type phosphate/phosphonate transport system substrate-binding protein
MALVAPVVAILVAASSGPAAEPSNSRDLIHIGIVGTLFRDVPETLVMALMEPFAVLMEAQTGLRGELCPAGQAYDLARKLAEDKLQIGVFQGIEYAWAQQRYADLQPLMVIITKYAHQHAFLVIRASDRANGFAGLKGKILAMPKFNHEHCYQFVEKHCRQLGAEPERFFSKIAKPKSAEDALDEVADGKVAGAVIETVPLECYKRRKPGRFAELSVAAASEVFPASVVVCHRGALPDEVIRRFREGMLNGQNTAIGRQLLMLWRVGGFETIPADYQTICRNIVKDYPPPAAK